MEQIVGVAQLYFVPHPLLEIVQRLMVHPVGIENGRFCISSSFNLTNMTCQVVELGSINLI